MLSEQLKALTPEDRPKVILIDYVNWKGERELRHILPRSATGGPSAPFWDANEWHETPQWLWLVWDLDKADHRMFALSGIHAMLPYEEPKNDFGKQLREARNAEGKALLDVANVLKISTMHIIQMEQGDRQPPDAVDIRKICQMLAIGPIRMLEAARVWAPKALMDPGEIRGFFDATCRHCKRRFGWSGRMSDRPTSCPKCNRDNP